MSSEPERESRDWRRTFAEFIRFGMVGGSGVVVNLVVAYIMTQLNGGVGNDNRILFQLPGPWAFRWTLLVWIVGFLVANLWNFQLNRVWTFRRDRMRGWWEEFWPFFTIGLAAAAVGALLKVGFTNPTSPIYLPDPWFTDPEGLRGRAYWAQLFTFLLTMPINYIVNKLWTFRTISDPDTSPARGGARPGASVS